MPDTPFFRGVNRMDWLYAVLLQNACDWCEQSKQQAIADQFGLSLSYEYPDPTEYLPTVRVFVTSSFVFVVSNSTQSVPQWIGNILGSSYNTDPLLTGACARYFLDVAKKQYQKYRQVVLDNLSGRKLVLIGFSLGAASVTIQKAIWKQTDGIDSACVAFGCPRPGSPEFANAFPVTDYNRFQVINDPVPSVPPPLWSSIGNHEGWFPTSDLVPYQQVSTGSTLYNPSEIRPGDQLQPTADVILAFDLGTFRNFHNQGLYARILRTGLPFTLEDGYQGYPQASTLDGLASQTLYTATPWIWAPNGEKSTEVSHMLQFNIFIRNRYEPLGMNEVYYFAGSDPSALMDQFAPESPASIMGKRLAFLSKGAEIYALRASYVGTPRKSRLFKYRTPQVGMVNSFMTEINEAIVYYAYNSDRSCKRTFHFRGLGATWISTDELTPTGNSGLALIDAWLAQLKTLGLRINKPGQATNGKITGFVKAALGAQVTMTTEIANNIPAGSLINITGIRSYPLINGNWLTPGTGGLSSQSIPLQATEKLEPPTSTTGTWKRLQYGITDGETVESFAFNGVSKRDTGRPSFLRRGRRSARFKHR